ncbi:MAG TPA: PQQ-dependent dehydrogenase, methanol/ethanol family [Nevskiaceae bacterium]|nr:PQQ-dependent dehydrogenase, methanol/ethanol family [Nevskiaceae bacterium]
MRVTVLILGALVALVSTAACKGRTGVPASSETASSIERALASPSWATGGHDDGQTYFSPLDRINVGNANQLGFAWSYDLDSTHGQESTPVVIGGVLYASAPWGFVHALDARTGKRLWSFDPKVDNAITSKVCCGIVNRGLAVAQGRIFVASIDGRLFALEAKTGEIAWEVETIVDRARGYTVTGSTYVAGDVVLIGNSGAELDARGYVSAYDLRSGQLRWRFYTVPASAKGPFEHPELEAAARTWDPNSFWEVGLGGTVWDGMAYDPGLGLVYVGVGNSALYPRKLRSPSGGDNLYVSSILALHADTGRLAWHYQTTPGDQWDYTATQKLILADLVIGGRKRSVVMQAPKNGFFYVLDRATGELLSAKPYVPVTWASHVDMKTGRPVETGQGDYAEKPRLIFPAPSGGHNWQPMAFNPRSGLVYIPALQAGIVFWMPKEPFQYQKGAVNLGAIYTFAVENAGDFGLGGEGTEHLPPLREMAAGQPDTTIRSYLRAWDPVANQVAWEVETSGQWVGQPNALWNGGGVMTTGGGLVFQGRSTGVLHVYRADTGQQLAAINLGTSIMAAPMTYEIDGEQYVAVMAGFGGALGGTHFEGTAAYRYGNAGRLIVLRLGGGAVPLPAEIAREARFPHPAAARHGTPESIARGTELFTRHCNICHKNSAAAGTVPDLRRISAQTHAQFEDIVLGGTRASRGMGSFAGVLSREDVDAIRAAMISDAWKAYEAELAVQPSATHTPPPASHPPATSP